VKQGYYSLEGLSLRDQSNSMLRSWVPCDYMLLSIGSELSLVQGLRLRLTCLHTRRYLGSIPRLRAWAKSLVFILKAQCSGCDLC